MSLPPATAPVIMFLALSNLILVTGAFVKYCTPSPVRCSCQGVGHPATVVGDPAHGVGEVPVEAGEEAEAVLAREVQPRWLARARDRNAAGLATRQRPLLVDGDLEAALDQFVGGTHARHATPEN